MYNVDFMDSTGSPASPTYGAADVNNIRKTLLSKGVLRETADACKVVASSASGNIIISAGQAVMADGSRIEILAGGEELTILSGGTNYVYFHRDDSLNTIVPKISLTAPLDEDVPLAEIAQSVITDKRQFSYAKPAFSPNSCIYFEHQFTAAGLTVSTWQSLGSVNLPAGYNKIAFCKANGDLSVFFIDIQNQCGYGWEGNSEGIYDFETTEMRDSRFCFPSNGDRRYTIWINIASDNSIMVYPTSSENLSLSETIKGFAFYGGAQ